MMISQFSSFKSKVTQTFTKQPQSQQPPNCLFSSSQRVKHEPFLGTLPNGKATWTTSVPNTKNTIFEGGGAKGFANVGVLLALQERGLSDEVENVEGTSIGALSALLWSVGMSPQDIKAHLYSENFLKLITKRDGSLLHQFLDGMVKESLQKLPPTWNWEVERIRHKQKITFQDLETLYKFDSTRFKKLHVMAYCNETQRDQPFNAENTPDVDILDACRASAALPLIFKPVNIVLNGTNYSYYDGGINDNIPSRISEEDDNPWRIENDFGGNMESFLVVFNDVEDRNGQTVFDNAKFLTRKELMGYGEHTAHIYNEVLKIFGIKPEKPYSEASVDGMRHCLNYEGLIDPLKTNLGVLSFRKAHKNFEKLVQIGYNETMQRTWNLFGPKGKNMYRQEYDNLTELLLSISKEDFDFYKTHYSFPPEANNEDVDFYDTICNARRLISKTLSVYLKTHKTDSERANETHLEDCLRGFWQELSGFDFNSNIVRNNIHNFFQKKLKLHASKAHVMPPGRAV